MQADLPHTLYLSDKKRKGKKPGKAFKFNPTDPAIAKTQEAIRKKRERMGAEGKEVPYTMDELFNKK